MIEGRIMWVVGFFVPRFYDIPTFTHTLSTPPPTMDPRRSYHLRSSRSLCPSLDMTRLAMDDRDGPWDSRYIS